MSKRRLAFVSWTVLAAAACNASTAPSASVAATGILLVDVGEQVQAVPPTEALKMAHSDALRLAEANGDDLGYPWFDPSTGELVLSAVTPRGRDLIETAKITVPHRIRTVTHSAAELQHILDDAISLRSQGVPGAVLIYATRPDQRDNRALIVISSMSRPLLDALAERYPADALAIMVDPSGGS